MCERGRKTCTHTHSLSLVFSLTWPAHDGTASNMNAHTHAPAAAALSSTAAAAAAGSTVTPRSASGVGTTCTQGGAAVPGGPPC
jgi:hypothetical protein